MEHARPVASRPHMPDYGIAPAPDGVGLLPWSWALERLERSHEYWVATVGPDQRPHVTPVWGVLLDGEIWFSCAPSSRKGRNLRQNRAVTITTDDAHQPVIVEGTAQPIDDLLPVAAFTATVNDKYESSSTVEFFSANSTFRVVPTTVFGLDDADFGGTPTRWSFSSD